MNLTIEKLDLEKQIAHVIGAAGDGKSMQILSHLLLTVSNGNATLSATDLTIEMTTDFPVIDSTDGAVCIPGKKFHEIVKELPSGAVTIAADTKASNTITITAGKSRFNIVCLPAQEFPALKKAETEDLVPFGAAGFSSFLAQVRHAICPDETKYNLCGVYLHRAGNALLAVATNGHRLARTLREKALPENFLTKGIIIPRKAVVEICKLADSAPEGEDICIAHKDNNIQVTSGSIRLAARLVDGEYPDYNRVIPAGGGTFATISKRLLAEAIRRISIITEEKQGRAKLVFSNGLLNVSATGPTTGDATEEFPISYEGAPAEVHVNPRYALDALAALDKDKEEEFRVTLHEDGKPLLLESIKTGFLSVIMPMRA